MPLENEGSARHALLARKLLVEDKDSWWVDWLSRNAEFDDAGNPIYNEYLQHRLLLHAIKTEAYATEGGDVAAAQALVKQFARAPEQTFRVKVEGMPVEEIDREIIDTLVANGYAVQDAVAIAAANAGGQTGPLLAAYQAIKQRELGVGGKEEENDA